MAGNGLLKKLVCDITELFTKVNAGEEKIDNPEELNTLIQLAEFAKQLCGCEGDATELTKFIKLAEATRNCVSATSM